MFIKISQQKYMYIITLKVDVFTMILKGPKHARKCELSFRQWKACSRFRF